jgi:hypothetical protein
MPTFMKPFERAYIPQAETDALRAELMAKPDEFLANWIAGYDPARKAEHIEGVIAQSKAEAYWRNDKYQVSIFEAVTVADFPAMWHVSIKRNDRAPIFNWRDIQAIKNELFGAEHEAVQLFPAESRLVDGANQYHLFVLKDPEIRFPFGFQDRVVTDEPIGKSKNRPR